MSAACLQLRTGLSWAYMAIVHHALLCARRFDTSDRYPVMATTHPQSDATEPHSAAVIEPPEASFLVIHCRRCAKDVLSARDLDEQGQLGDFCLHCEAALDRDHPSAKWVGAGELVERGYLVEGHESPADGDTGRGCRGGSCGIEQPE